MEHLAPPSSIRSSLQEQGQVQQLNQLQYQTWLRESTTIRVLVSLRQLLSNQTHHAVICGPNPGISEITLRCSLTKAATLEQIINRIEKGELNETTLL